MWVFVCLSVCLCLYNFVCLSVFVCMSLSVCFSLSVFYLFCSGPTCLLYDKLINTNYDIQSVCVYIVCGLCCPVCWSVFQSACLSMSVFLYLFHVCLSLDSFVSLCRFLPLPLYL